MKKSGKVSTVIALLLLYCFPTLYGWCPIAHYEITKAAGYPEIAKYAQLPGYTDSWKTVQFTSWDGLFDICDISYLFCWSHAVQDAGAVHSGLVPLIPFYSDDGRYPGRNMWTLIDKKLANLNSTDKAEMIKTAKGFIAHNAADRPVHWSYFKGATENDSSLGISAELWSVHHAKKERWADYWIYIENNFGGDANSAFDKKGKLILKGDYASSNGVPTTSSSDGMAGIMRLSQIVYRKNRRATEKDDSSGSLSVQSVKDIKKSVNDKIVKALKGKNFNKTYNKEDFDELNLYNWSKVELWQYYDTSKSNVSSWLTNYCN